MQSERRKRETRKDEEGEKERERVTERIKEGEEQNLGGFQSQTPEGQKET